MRIFSSHTYVYTQLRGSLNEKTFGRIVFGSGFCQARRTDRCKLRRNPNVLNYGQVGHSVNAQLLSNTCSPSLTDLISAILQPSGTLMRKKTFAVVKCDCAFSPSRMTTQRDSKKKFRRFPRQQLSSATSSVKQGDPSTYKSKPAGMLLQNS